LAGLATSSADKAARFTAFAPDCAIYENYEALLAAPQIEAVYIPLPNHLHVEWTLKAIEAGKHVLCEKPMTMEAASFDGLIDARDRSGLHVAEAYMIVHHPQFLRARDLLAGGAIGNLRHVDATFTYFNDDPSNIRNQADAGGGGLPDIGVYTFGSVRFITGQDSEVVPFARIDFEEGVDTFVQMAATFPGFSYSAVVSMRAFPRQELVFHGDKGVMRLTCPFNSDVHDQAEIHVETTGKIVQIERFPGVNQYVLQVEAFGRTLREGVPYACPLEFSHGTQQMIDMTYAAARA
jgi:predicted dehydrogenase